MTNLRWLFSFWSILILIFILINLSSYLPCVYLIRFDQLCFIFLTRTLWSSFPTTCCCQPYLYQSWINSVGLVRALHICTCALCKLSPQQSWGWKSSQAFKKLNSKKKWKFGDHQIRIRKDLILTQIFLDTDLLTKILPDLFPPLLFWITISFLPE